MGGPPRFLGADECGGHRAGFPDVQNFRLVHNPGTCLLYTSPIPDVDRSVQEACSGIAKAALERHIASLIDVYKRQVWTLMGNGTTERGWSRRKFPEAFSMQEDGLCLRF